MRDRVGVVLVLLPIGIVGISLGGIWFLLLITALLLMAIFEFSRLFDKQGVPSALHWSLISTVLIIVTRHFYGFKYDHFLLPFIILVAMTIHLGYFEKGINNSATSLGITLTAIFYIGYLGSFMLALRNMENGMWWFLLSLPSGWFADSGAYEIGRRWGKHKMAPHLSPKKSWEGYFSGIASSIIAIFLLIALYKQLGMPVDLITPTQAIILGALMGILPTLGDLGASMVKRQAQEKDSGTLLKGHGGVFDRIDSWLWMGFIGYAFVTVISMF